MSSFQKYNGKRQLDCDWKKKIEFWNRRFIIINFFFFNEVFMILYGVGGKKIIQVAHRW